MNNLKVVTTSNLKDCTEQEVFDFIANHLLTQKVKASNELGKCFYRTSDGRKCAAGCIIEDSFYKESFEGHDWSFIKNEYSTESINLDYHFKLIYNLQSIHDTKGIIFWKESLKRLAEERNLSTEILDKF